jgi:hypothetical protein
VLGRGGDLSPHRPRTSKVSSGRGIFILCLGSVASLVLPCTRLLVAGLQGRLAAVSSVVADRFPSLVAQVAVIIEAAVLQARPLSEETSSALPIALTGPSGKKLRTIDPMTRCRVVLRANESAREVVRSGLRNDALGSCNESSSDAWCKQVEFCVGQFFDRPSLYHGVVLTSPPMVCRVPPKGNEWRRSVRDEDLFGGEI